MASPSQEPLSIALSPTDTWSAIQLNPKFFCFVCHQYPIFPPSPSLLDISFALLEYLLKKFLNKRLKYTSVRTAKQKIPSTANASEDEKKRDHTHCWWDCETVQPLWERARQLLPTLNVCFPCDTANALGISTREMHYAHLHANVHSSFTGNSPTLEKSHVLQQGNGSTLAYAHQEVSHSNKKGQIRYAQ